ncbi:MAG: tripartite tricarboxylate transporter substrate binding protein [Pseudomonadota bacterium]
MPLRRAAILTLLVSLVVPSPPLTHESRAASFPSKTVRIVIPFSAGGAPDVLMRIIAPHLSEKWKQPVIVENRPGANTNIGTVVVTKADADGHTLLFTADGTFILNPLIYSSMPYSVSELAPVSLVATASAMLAIGTHVPANTVSEFIALAKAKPGTLNYGSTGPASIQRLQMEYFSALTGVQLLHVPFKGANETTMAMLANQIDSSIPTSSNVLPHIPTGKLRALAITTAKRSPKAPDVPTMQEAGVEGYETYSMFGLFAPAGTPADTIKKIHSDLTEVAMRPEIQELLAARSFEVEGKNGAEFQKIIDRDTVKWQKVITAAKIRED